MSRIETSLRQHLEQMRLDGVCQLVIDLAEKMYLMGAMDMALGVMDGEGDLDQKMELFDEIERLADEVEARDAATERPAELH